MLRVPTLARQWDIYNVLLRTCTALPTPCQVPLVHTDSTYFRTSLRATRLSNAWILEGSSPGFVGALKAAGALGAWKPVSGVSFAVGGCGFGAVLSNDPLLSPAG